MALLPTGAFAQTPPTPPAPPVPPVAPAAPGRDHDRDRDRGPKVPVTFLGVETSPVPQVVSEQLGLAKGFGLVVDYIVPDGPAAAAGVQQNDILKMLNDQILMEPDQLGKLVRSFSEGTTVTLSILRKGKDEKLTVKLGKKEVPQRRRFGFDGDRNMFDFKFQEDMGKLGRELGEDLRKELAEVQSELQKSLGDMDKGIIRDVVDTARREAQRAGDEARKAAREIRVLSQNDGSMKSTKIDLGKAQIVYSDSQGEMKIDNIDGKKVLTAKDPQGKLLFSGPVDSADAVAKLPADVRQRFEKLEQKDLPSVAPPASPESDEDDEDDSGDGDDRSNASYQQISTCPMQRPLWGMNLLRL